MDPSRARPGRLPSRRIRIGHVWVDAVTFDGALEAISELVRGGGVGGPHGARRQA